MKRIIGVNGITHIFIVPMRSPCIQMGRLIV